MAEWTPGPWRVSDITAGKRGTSSMIWRTNGGDPPTGYKRIAQHVHNSADARLIAAAPALYEALQNLAYYEARISPPPYGHKCRWCGDCVQRAKDEARAALRQARGEE